MTRSDNAHHASSNITKKALPVVVAVALSAALVPVTGLAYAAAESKLLSSSFLDVADLELSEEATSDTGESLESADTSEADDAKNSETEDADSADTDATHSKTEDADSATPSENDAEDAAANEQDVDSAASSAEGSADSLAQGSLNPIPPPRGSFDPSRVCTHQH